VETREEVSGVTTGGERAPDGFGDRRANFVDIADVGGYQEGSGGFIGNIGTSGNAFGCWEEDAKGLGSIGCV
jgi:hypothetical protein